MLLFRANSAMIRRRNWCTLSVLVSMVTSASARSGAAVSYTHLDVYKRQVMVGELACDLFCRFFDIDGRLFVVDQAVDRGAVFMLSLIHI